MKKRTTDHPRLRGEKHGFQLNKRRILGSPPLTRGKGYHCTLRTIPFGITPAYAGKSCVCARYRTQGWDHPRLRGEKGRQTRRRKKKRGSPPLTRGKDSILKVKDKEPGITPAYAGKRFPPCFIVPSEQDHPRLRGEKPNSTLHTIQ